MDASNLSWSWLHAANFEGAVLDAAAAAGSIFQCADLAGASLRGVMFIGSSFEGAHIEDADLADAFIYVTPWRMRGKVKNINACDCNLRTDRLASSRVWWPKRGRVFGWLYAQWLDKVKQKSLDGVPAPARKIVEKKLSILEPVVQDAAADRSTRERWREVQGSHRARKALERMRLQIWEKMACRPESAPYVAQGIIPNFGGLISADLAHVLIGGNKAGCSGAQGMSAIARQKLQEIIAKSEERVPNNN